MKKALSILRNLLVRTCVLFTVLFVSLFTIGILSHVSGWAFDLSKMYMVLLFSFLMSVCGLIFRLRLPAAAAYLLHFAASAVSCYVIFIVWLEYAGNAGITLIVLFLFLLLYALFLAVSLAFRGRQKKKTEKATAYEPQFSGNGRKKR